MKKIAAMFADGFEEVEALAVVDLLRRAEVETTMISVMGHRTQVRGAHGITVMTDACLDDISMDSYDGIFLPGGMPGADNLEDCDELCDAIIEFNGRGKLLAAICAAPKIYGRLGILRGRKATCFPGFEHELLGAELSRENVAEDGHIVTSRGMGTAIELGLRLVSVLKGSKEAEELSKNIQYR